jgi:hypothetical protein
MKLGANSAAPTELGGGDGFTINMSPLMALPNFAVSFSTEPSGFQPRMLSGKGCRFYFFANFCSINARKLPPMAG